MSDDYDPNSITLGVLFFVRSTFHYESHWRNWIKDCAHHGIIVECLIHSPVPDKLEQWIDSVNEERRSKGKWSTRWVTRRLVSFSESHPTVALMKMLKAGLKWFVNASHFMLVDSRTLPVIPGKKVVKVLNDLQQRSMFEISYSANPEYYSLYDYETLFNNVSTSLNLIHHMYPLPESYQVLRSGTSLCLSHSHTKRILNVSETLNIPEDVWTQFWALLDDSNERGREMYIPTTMSLLQLDMSPMTLEVFRFNLTYVQSPGEIQQHKEEGKDAKYVFHSGLEGAKKEGCLLMRQQAM